MKKKLLISMFLLLFSFCFIRLNVNALEATDDTKKATYTTTSTSSKSVISGGACVYTSDYGTCENKKIHVSILAQTCDEENKKTKAVSWAIIDSTGTGFKRGTVAEIAADYEKNHPGWIVLGGINSDQYTLGFGNGIGADGKFPYTVQTYYPLICDGQNYFSNTWMHSGSGSNGNFVGLLNDGSADPLLMVSASSESAKTKLVCSIYDENGDIIKKFDCDSFNGTGETVVFSGYYSDTNFGTFIPKNCYGKNLFIVESADLCYCSNSSEYTNVSGCQQDAFYGVGTISKKMVVADLEKGQFAISTTNEELLEYLNIGVKIRCQYEYVNETYASIKECIGFHTVQRANDVDNSVSGSYNTNARPRSIIGRKSTGQIVLMTLDDYKDSYGTTGYGINAICKAYGIVEAYQMDGGGSAQMAVRQENGTFKGVTYSADYSFVEGNTSSQRKVLTAALFVMRDPSFKEEFSVKYNLNSGTIVGEEVLSEKYTAYSDLVLPELEKDGCIFDGWYLDANFENKVNRKVTGNITLYAKFYRLGDMDNNDVVDLVDAIMMRLYMAGEIKNDYYYDVVFDYDQDGYISNDDIKQVQEIIIK